PLHAIFFLSLSAHLVVLYSFPTRRSSDLFLINSLDVGRGGLTKACIQQANMSAELGYKTTILTFNYNSDYDIITKKLFQYYSINRDVEIRNMYDFYRDEKKDEKNLTYVNDFISSDYV